MKKMAVVVGGALLLGGTVLAIVGLSVNSLPLFLTGLGIVIFTTLGSAYLDKLWR